MLKPLLIECRAAYRLSRLSFHLLRGLFVVRFLFPLFDEARRRQVKQRWSGQVLDILGVRLLQPALDVPAPTLIVSNHISWLDIFVINAVIQTHFVCKEEVKRWPLIGWLVEHTDTVFIERGSRAAAARTAQAIVARLKEGDRVAVFPEGTTTDGSLLLPFKAALFQAAVTADAAATPLALRYEDATTAQLSTAPAYDGDITLWECIRAIAKADSLQVRLSLQASIKGVDRRAFAKLAETSIADALRFPIRHTDEEREGETEADATLNQRQLAQRTADI